jgi:Fe2+ or Zn2+ uptake regulation protein
MSGETLSSIIIRNCSALTKVTKESLIKQLREKGLKITTWRLAIIDVLIEHGALHSGGRVVYEEAKKKKKSLSLSTAYATFNEFSLHGIIKLL